MLRLFAATVLASLALATGAQAQGGPPLALDVTLAPHRTDGQVDYVDVT